MRCYKAVKKLSQNFTLWVFTKLRDSRNDGGKNESHTVEPYESYHRKISYRIRQR